MRLRKPKSLRLRYVAGAISVLLCVGVIAIRLAFPGDADPRGFFTTPKYDSKRQATVLYFSKDRALGEIGYSMTRFRPSDTRLDEMKWRLMWEPHSDALIRPRGQWIFAPTNEVTSYWYSYMGDHWASREVIKYEAIGCYFAILEADKRTGKSNRGFEIALPTWLLIILTLLWPTRLAISFIRRTKNPHACPTCGYDLRATPDRCPECGTRVTKPTDAATGVADRVA